MHDVFSLRAGNMMAPNRGLGFSPYLSTTLAASDNDDDDDDNDDDDDDNDGDKNYNDDGESGTWQLFSSYFLYISMLLPSVSSGLRHALSLTPLIPI